MAEKQRRAKRARQDQVWGEVMTMRKFIQENRAEIDRLINAVMFRHDGNGGRGQVPDPPPKRNDDERRQWVLNDEWLYRWARSSGVKC